MSDTAHDRNFAHLSPAQARLGSLFARPKVAAVACVAALALLGWVYLALMVADMLAMGGAGPLGPGMGVFDRILPQPDGFGRALLEALCRPTFGGRAHLGMPAAGAWNISDYAVVFLMWAAMTFAMMLPTAGPMIYTYAQIADTAAGKGERVVSPVMLAAGYAAIWLGFAVAATLMQGLLTRLALLDPAMASANGLFSGAVFIGAGVYQFSALKQACVTQCQRPLPFFFAHWTDRRWGVVWLGWRQGLYCLGCCWALMLVMFAVGVMNVVWMAALGLVMVVEKLSATTRFSRAVGVVLGAIGIALIASAVVAHWPAA